MPYELVRLLNSDHPYRYDGTIFGGTKLWTPREITTALWLDADSPSSITLNGATVSQWNDLSGNGRHATQATAASQPTYTASAINSKPAMTFDGSNDSMTSSTGSYGPDISIYAVTSLTSGIDYKRLINIGTTDTNGFFGTGGAGQTFFATFFGNPAIGWNDTSANTPNVSLLGKNAVVGVVNGANVATPYVDGTAQNTKNGAMATATGVVLGEQPTTAGQFWSGPVGEIVITNYALSTVDRQKLEGYLAWKWGTQASLPVSHPYYSAPPLA